MEGCSCLTPKETLSFFLIFFFFVLLEKPLEMTRKQSHCCAQQEPEKCCVPSILPFNSELFLIDNGQLLSVRVLVAASSFVFQHLQRVLLRDHGWAEFSQSLRFGRAHLSDLTENLPKFHTPTTNCSQQLEARGFLSWHRVRTLSTASACSALKPCVTGKPEPASSVCASAASGLQQRCFLPCHRADSGSPYAM